MPPVVDPQQQPSPYPALITLYATMTLYGALSGIFGVRTLDTTAGDYYGVIWPFLVVIAAVFALVGVVVSWRTQRHLIEIAATVCLGSLLVGYAAAIVLRGHLDADYNGYPFAVLPIALLIYPGFRLLALVRRVTNR